MTSPSAGTATGRRGWVVPVGIFVLVAAFQLITLGVHPAIEGDDYVAYLANAYALANHTPYGMPAYLINPDYAGGSDMGQAAYPLGLPLLLMPIARLVGNNLPAMLYGAAALSCVLLALFAGLFSLLARRLAGPGAGVLAGLVAGFNPFLFDQGAFRTPSEPAFLVALIATLLLDIRLAKSNRLRDAGWLGAAAAAAGLVRVVGVLLIPATVLAELWRRRRVSHTVLLAGGIAVLVVALGLAAMGADYFARNVAIFAGGHPVAVAASPSVALSTRLPMQVLGNLAALPGNLSVFWSYGWGHDSRIEIILHRPLQGVGLLLLVAAAAGFVLRCRRGLGTMEIFAVLQTMMLLALPPAQQSPRYYLPVSVLALIYILVACDAGGRLRGWRFSLAGAAIAAVMLANWPNALTIRAVDERFSILDPRATEVATWVRSQTAPDAVLLSHRPRSFIILTDRTASDFTAPAADAAFEAWATSIGARVLIMSIDTPTIADRATQRGLNPTDATLNLMLDGWEAEFFASQPGGAPVPAFRNTRFRVYRLGHP